MADIDINETTEIPVPENEEAEAAEPLQDAAEEAAVPEGEGTADMPDGAEETQKSGKPSGKDKKIFRKKDKKKDERDAKIEELTDRLTRQMAEFDNYRKRTEKEKSAMYAIGAKDIIEKILPVLDNFERGLEAADESDPFAEGMMKIYKQFTTVLADLGVSPIEAVGQQFDPNYHNAVMHVEDGSVGENIVVEEFQKGYTYKDSIVRHSMVKVAN